jgi:hypothetical protein
MAPKQAHQAAPRAQSDGWLNTMPFHKTPPLKAVCGMTQRVLAGATLKWVEIFCSFKVQNA